MRAELEELLTTAVAAAKAGAETLSRHFRDSALEVRSKGRNDFVSRADHESEEAIVGVIRRRFPGHRILAEESGELAGREADYQWLVDPLDGTTNFVRGLPIYSVSVACRRGEELVAAAILDPQGGNLFSARRGGGAYWNDRRLTVSSRPSLDGAFLATGYPFRAQAALTAYLDVFRAIFQHSGAIRRCGSAALDLAYTAAGIYDGFFEFRLSPWDVAAGALLVEEAGGKITDLDGGPRFLTRGNVLAGGLAVHGALQEIAARHASEQLLDALVP